MGQTGFKPITSHIKILENPRIVFLHMNDSSRKYLSLGQVKPPETAS
jgi:hypothetical protein